MDALAAVVADLFEGVFEGTEDVEEAEEAGGILGNLKRHL